MISSPIRGMHFHPPAKVIIQHAAAGLPLILQPDPENPYDSSAIKVLVAKSELGAMREILDYSFPDMGLDPEEWWGEDADEVAFLGFIGKEFTSDWHGVLGAATPILAFDGAGKPLCQWETHDETLSVPSYNPAPDAGDR